LGGSDPQISTISSVQHNKFYLKSAADSLSPRKQSSAQWHSDIAFEPIPADYTSLRLVELPTTGGGVSIYLAVAPTSWLIAVLIVRLARHSVGIGLRDL
jgi:alpha-ketoglutarate-dependent taurine dioxygenase